MVRPAAPSDAPSIARVHVESWRTTYDGLLPEDHLAALDVADYAGRWERSLSSPFARGAVFVAEEAVGIVGFASGGPERDGDPRYEGELYAIYLLREFQGRGVGHAHAADAEERVGGANAVEGAARGRPEHLGEAEAELVQALGAALGPRPSQPAHLGVEGGQPGRGQRPLDQADADQQRHAGDERIGQAEQAVGEQRQRAGAEVAQAVREAGRQPGEEHDGQ